MSVDSWDSERATAKKPKRQSRADHVWYYPMVTGMICNFDLAEDAKASKDARGQAISTNKEVFFEGDIARRRVDPAQWLARSIFEQVGRCFAAEQVVAWRCLALNEARLSAGDGRDGPAFPTVSWRRRQKQRDIKGRKSEKS